MTTEHPDHRPAWLDGNGMVLVLAAATAMWTYYAVTALVRGAVLLAALDALLLIATAWTLARTLQRRRHRAG